MDRLSKSFVFVCDINLSGRLSFDKGLFVNYRRSLKRIRSGKKIVLKTMIFLRSNDRKWQRVEICTNWYVGNEQLHVINQIEM